MAIYNQIPSAFLWNDLRDTLNANGGSVVNNDAKSAFDSRAKINKWSFNKPLQKAQIEDLTDTDRYALNDGFTFSSYNTLTDLNNAITNNSAWVYNYPTSYFRTGDYRGYDTKATEWFIPTFKFIQIDKYLSVSISKNIRATLKQFAYWRNLLTSSAGTYYLTLYLQAGSRSYMVSMCDVASITETGTEPIFLNINSELPSGTYNCAIGISAMGSIGILQNAEALGFYPLSDSWTQLNAKSLDDEVRDRFANMSLVITSMSASRSAEGGGFYTYEVTSITAKVTNNNPIDVSIFLKDGFILAGSKTIYASPIGGSGGGFTITKNGGTATVTYTFNSLTHYTNTTQAWGGLEFKMFDASNVTTSVRNAIT